MLTMEDTVPIAEDLISGFHELLREEPEAVQDFLDAFRRREQFAGLPETRGIAEGLDEVLAGLLSSVFTLSASHSKSPNVAIPKDVIQLFDRVLRQLPQRHPAALLLFKKHLLRYRCKSEEALAALLRMYAVNSGAYPY
jgi:hypothetical protein